MPKKKRITNATKKKAVAKKPPAKRKRSPRKHKKVFFLQRVQTLSLHTKLLFIIGFVLISIPLIFYANETIQLAFFTPQVPVIHTNFAAPTHIVITKVQLDLSIVEEVIHNGAWGISDNAISHLTTSARPGQAGPIILYGHNTTDRFGPIRWLSVGDTIQITTADKKVHTYVITKTQDVSPSQINFLTNVHGETLILYTCDGFADLQRFLVYATPKKN